MQRTATPLTSVRFRSQPPVMNIVVTGSAGFIGYHLVKRLLQDNHKVFGVDNLNNYYSKALKEDRNSLLNHKNYFFHHLDLNELGKIKETLT